MFCSPLANLNLVQNFDIHLCPFGIFDEENGMKILDVTGSGAEVNQHSLNATKFVSSIKHSTGTILIGSKNN